MSSDHKRAHGWNLRLRKFKRFTHLFWNPVWLWVKNALAIIGVVSLVISFFPFISAWIGQPEIAVRVREDDRGKSVIRGRKGDFGVMVGTVNLKHEVVLQEVRVTFNVNELNLQDNDIFTEVGLTPDGKAWVEWRGEQALQPRNFCLFAAPFEASAILTNTTTLEVTVKSTVPSSELGFPWNIFPPPPQKAMFPVVLHWEADETGGRAGYLLGAKEGVTMFGSAATNALWGWARQGTAELRVLTKVREKKPGE